MEFTKMEALANDFVMVNAVNMTASRQSAIIARTAWLCDRRRGVGGDGVIFVLPSETHDFRMRIFNSDGSEAEMCGNGIRCFSSFARHKGLTDKNSLSIQTGAGTICTEAAGDKIRVDMGSPVLAAPRIPVAQSEGQVIDRELAVDDRTFRITAVSMGNPHAVIFVDELTDELMFDWGERIERHPFFPNRVNVEFIRMRSAAEVDMRVFERGCGETWACGTGACAAAVAGILTGRHNNTVTIHLRGGDLIVSWDGNPEHSVFKTGPARIVFEGSVDI